MNKALKFTPLAVIIASGLVGCDQQAKLTPEQQSGSDPHLPVAENFMVPPMQVPDTAGGQQAVTPKAAAGLKIEKIVSDLKHPRQIYVLPDNDVLVVESNGPGTQAVTTPEQPVASRVKNKPGKGARGGNQITL